MGTTSMALVQVCHYGNDPWAQYHWPRSEFADVKMSHGRNLLALVHVWHCENDPWVKCYWPWSKFAAVKMSHGHNFIGPGPCLALRKCSMGTISLALVRVCCCENDPWA
jgi:hypothetical protein